MKNFKPKREFWISAAIIVLAVAVYLITAYSPFYSAKGGSASGGKGSPPEEGGISSPLTKFKLSSAREVFHVVQAEEVWPKILEATIDPPDVHVGDIQRLKIIVQGPDAIVSVEAKTKLDNGEVIIPLKLAGEVSARDLTPNHYYADEGGKLVLRNPNLRTHSNAPSDTFKDSKIENSLKIAKLKIENSTPLANAQEYPKLKYAAEWKVHDTHDTYYRTTFIVKDAKGRVNDITLAWSDACGIPMQGNWTSSANCAISTNHDGVEQGDVILNHTLTVSNGYNFAWNPGQSITIGSGGGIVIGANSELKQTYIWVSDFDADLYYNFVMLQNTDPGVGWDRRWFAIKGANDCKDNNANVYQTISGLGLDNDQEGWYTGQSVTQCVGDSRQAIYEHCSNYPTDCSEAGFIQYTDSTGTKYVTIATAGGGNDCNDNNSNIYRTVVAYRDEDHDGLYSYGAAGRCAGDTSIINGRTYYYISDLTLCLMGQYIAVITSSGADPDDCTAAILR